ncbi:unnamed protein product [Moneuplotes crassus]|uniref:RING-type domain-containing protein n=2 Tax=Euplotes crassus TaxID=5936 RepID=A0AAD2CYM7_EUPCR|nr:unnamed protein product [Moneuplotes crassus]
MLIFIQSLRKENSSKIKETLETMKLLQDSYKCWKEKMKVMEKLTFLTLILSINKEDIQYMDFTPESEEDQITYKYNCPVCLRYFDKILAGKCCGNYLCHLCIDDFIKMADRNKHYKMKCPMCNHEELDLQDADPEDEVKRYGNTFINTNQLKETLKEVGDNEDKNFLNKVDQFLEKIQLKQASSANNFHPNKLEARADSRENSEHLDHSPENKSKTLIVQDKENVDRLGVNMLTSQNKIEPSNDSLNYRDDIEEQKGSDKMSPQEELHSANDDNSINSRDLISEQQKKRMEKFHDQNQEDDRAYINMSENA